jgi:hypothetical protein
VHFDSQVSSRVLAVANLYLTVLLANKLNAGNLALPAAGCLLGAAAAAGRNHPRASHQPASSSHQQADISDGRRPFLQFGLLAYANLSAPCTCGKYHGHG